MGSLQDLTKTNYLALSQRDQYYYLGGVFISNGDLYDVPVQERSTKISEQGNFTAGEFLKINGTYAHDKARIHPDLLIELERLRAFIGKPVKIVTAYMPRAYYENYRKKTLTKSNVTLLDFEWDHIRGAAVKIRVDKVIGPLLAKYVVFACSSNISIGVGAKDIILVADPKTPEIIAYNSTNRRTREKTIKTVALYQRYFTGIGHTDALHLLNSLNTLYEFLKIHLVKIPKSFKIPNNGRLIFLPTEANGHIPSDPFIGEPPTPQERDAIKYDRLSKQVEKAVVRVCKNPEVSADFITELLFYSRYYFVHRVFTELYFREQGKVSNKNRQAKAVQGVRALLCPAIQALSSNLDLEKASGQAIKYSFKSNCSNSDRNFRSTLLKTEIDQFIFNHIKNNFVLPYYRRVTKVPLVQYTVELDGPKANRRAEEQWDLPALKEAKSKSLYAIDITGRYERLITHSGDSRSSKIGQTLVINQAGNHFEGVLAEVWAPLNSKRSKKVFHDIYGELETTAAGNFLFRSFIRNSAEIDYIEIRKTTFQQFDILELTKHYVKAGKNPSRPQKFKKINNTTVLLGAELAALNNPLVLAHEWFPLLDYQIAYIKQIFSAQRMKKWLDKHLDNYNTDRGFTESNIQHEVRQGGAATSVEKAFKEIFSEKKEHGDRKASHGSRNHGVHITDALLASFYVRHILSQIPYKNNLTRLDYLLRILSKYGRGMPWTAAFLNAAPCVPGESLRNCKLYQYEITIKSILSVGASAKYGAKVSIGTIEFEIYIKKIAGDGNWAVGDTAKFKALALNLGAGLELSKPGLGIGGNPLPSSMTTTFSTELEWWPQDIPGQAYLTTFYAQARMPTVGGLASAGVKKSLYIGFDIYSRTPGDLRIAFPLGTGANISVSLKKPNFQSKKPLDYLPIPSAGAEGNFMLIKIFDWWSTKPKLKPIVVNRDYKVRLNWSKRLFFIFDSALLTPAARRLLRIVCCLELRYFMRPTTKVRVVGMADRVGTIEYNIGLSKNRALNTTQAIQEILAYKLKAKITTEWTGESNAAKSDTDEKENPKFRGCKIYIDGALVLSLGN